MEINCEMGSCKSKSKVEDITIVKRERTPVAKPQLRPLNLPIIIPKSREKHPPMLFVVREASQGMEDTVKSPMQ
ncbi:hypothetical protein SteCoe_23495 [Stentor coeruleus]|uniref:Uncharacterized protein n=1 Tax=Stentor coeruleus TaxID=5963 RepID=A0A1R2BK78_9CILI|nr:hypothetical protein SteCoe_23495 [Stentor coeruleus]